jgi:hypothetical protein
VNHDAPGDRDDEQDDGEYEKHAHLQVELPGIEPRRQPGIALSGTGTYVRVQTTRRAGLFVSPPGQLNHSADAAARPHERAECGHRLRQLPDELDLVELRRRSPGAYVANNQLDATSAEQLIAEGEADLVAFGRPFIANPDLVERIRIGAPLAEAPKEYWYGGNATGCSDWPAVQRETA